MIFSFLTFFINFQAGYWCSFLFFKLSLRSCFEKPLILCRLNIKNVSEAKQQMTRQFQRFGFFLFFRFPFATFLLQHFAAKSILLFLHFWISQSKSYENSEKETGFTEKYSFVLHSFIFSAFSQRYWKFLKEDGVNFKVFQTKSHFSSFQLFRENTCFVAQVKSLLYDKKKEVVDDDLNPWKNTSHN